MPNQVKMNENLPEIEKSRAMLGRISQLIPSSTQTLAKGPTQYVEGVAPVFLQSGKGGRVWDVDGNEYIDVNMGVGPISLGYAYPRVDRAIQAQLEQGISFSLVHELELQVAEQVADLIPNAEKVRFSKSGADITSAAIRVSRAFTGREEVVCCGYHGWHDWYIGTTGRNAGVPKAVKALTKTFQYNDVESLEKVISDQTACVIMEPVLFEAPKSGFLQAVRELCDKHGTLLIFDEIWTGFRLSLGGAQDMFGVRADLATFSKAIANGMPISVLVGRADVMDVFDNDAFFYTTFGGETLSLAAAQATILEMKEKDVLGYITEQGNRLKEGYNGIAEKLGLSYTRCQGLGGRSMVSFQAEAGDPLELKSFVQQELIRRGILWSGQHVLCFSHTTEEIDHILEAYEQVLPLLKEAVEKGQVREKILGKPVQPVFRKTK